MYDSHVSAGALPWTQLRELTALPDPLAGEEGPVFPKPHFHCRAFGLGPSGLSASPHPHFFLRVGALSVHGRRLSLRLSRAWCPVKCPRSIAPGQMPHLLNNGVKPPRSNAPPVKRPFP